MDVFTTIATTIVKEQALVIGPLAWSEAKKVSGLSIVDGSKAEVATQANATEVIDRLVAQYERLFGQASHEVCREAAAPLLFGLQPADVPLSLR